MTEHAVDKIGSDGESCDYATLGFVIVSSNDCNIRAILQPKPWEIGSFVPLADWL